MVLIIILSFWLVCTVILGTIGVLWSIEWRYRRNQVAWCDARQRLVVNVIAEARTVSQVPPHTNVKVDGATVRFSGQLVNFETLQNMLMIMLDQEAMRVAAGKSLEHAIDHLRKWEEDNPLPPAPHWPLRPAWLK